MGCIEYIEGDDRQIQIADKVVVDLKFVKQNIILMHMQHNECVRYLNEILDLCLASLAVYKLVFKIDEQCLDMTERDTEKSIKIRCT